MKKHARKPKTFSWRITVKSRPETVNAMKSRSSSGQSQQSRGCGNG